MSRQADINEANIRIKRWAKAAEDSGLVKGGAKPEVRTSALWPVGSRWRVFERMKWTWDAKAEGGIVDTEACVAAAATWGEALHKYAMWARDENRQAYFRDRQLRGESLHTPPPDPPEWAAFRKAQLEAVDRANQNTAEWIKRATRARMQWIGLDDPVKFELAWQKARSMGLVKAL